jgi:hypothetical protein
MLWGCGIGLPSPQPSPNSGRGSKKLSFWLRLPFSQNWEKGLGDEGKMLEQQQLDFEFGKLNSVSTNYARSPFPGIVGEGKVELKS